MAPSSIGGARQGGAGGSNSTSAGSNGLGGAGRSSFFQRFVYGPMFGWLGFFFQVAFWPLRRVSDFLLPLGAYEGMSQTSTEGASKQFRTYLKNTLLVNSDTGNDIVQLFSTKSYADLQQEASSSDALIMVFLHSPYHRSTNDFCRRLLCSPSMVRFLSENKDRVKSIGSSTATSQGVSLSHSLLASSFPVLALLQPVSRSGRSSSSNNGDTNPGGIAPGPVKLVFKAEGPTLMKLTAMQLTSLVTTTFQKHERTILEAATRRYEQEQATALRRQQDEEYQETLRQDQERERQRNEARLEAEAEEEQQREEEQRKITEETNRIDNARALLRDEPPKGTPGSARIRFRLPNGKQLDRRFEADETIGSLKAFLVLHFANELPESKASAATKTKEGNVLKRVALSTNFPKRIYGGEGNEDADDEKTLKECDLCPQAVLMVQDLDA